MHRWLTSFTDFLITNALVATWSPEQNHLGGRIPVLKCDVLPFRTVSHSDRYLHNPPLFSTPIHPQTDLPDSWKGAH